MACARMSDWMRPSSAKNTEVATFRHSSALRHPAPPCTSAMSSSGSTKETPTSAPVDTASFTYGCASVRSPSRKVGTGVSTGCESMPNEYATRNTVTNSSPARMSTHSGGSAAGISDANILPHYVPAGGAGVSNGRTCSVRTCYYYQQQTSKQPVPLLPCSYPAAVASSQIPATACTQHAPAPPVSRSRLSAVAVACCPFRYLPHHVDVRRVTTK